VYAVAGLGLAYLLLSAGAVLPRWTFVQRNDLSYGMSIYAFPVAQLLLLAGVGSPPVGVVVILDIAATIPLAAASWYLIEAPAQRFAPTLDRAWSKTVDVAPPPERFPVMTVTWVGRRGLNRKFPGRSLVPFAGPVGPAGIGGQPRRMRSDRSGYRAVAPPHRSTVARRTLTGSERPSLILPAGTTEVSRTGPVHS
jgi:hypothetical protein